MKKILLIEDDEAVRDSLAANLSNAGYAVTEADNGKTGIAKFENGPFDAVITDLIMPEKEGLETIQYLKKISPECPIIAISGASYAETYLEIAKKFGVNEVILKPFTRNIIFEKLNRILR
ncbi:MAG: response regulator [Chitinivibrionales bacterium]|nr:response regulator [Chitinivibrionales bacterium]